MDQFWSFGLIPSFPSVRFDLSLSLWEKTTMYHKTFTPDHAPLSISTEQQSQGLTFRKDCHLGHRHYGAAPGYGFSTIDEQEPQYFIPLTCDDRAVSISELPGCPTMSAPLLVPDLSLAAHLNGERDSAQATLPLEYITGENGTSSIGWNMQDHTSGHVMDHNATPSFPRTSLPLPYIIAQSSGFLQTNVDVSIFGDLYHDSVGPMMGLSSIPAFHDHTAGQVFDSNASGLSSRLSSLLPEQYLSNDFNDNVRLRLEQARTEMASPGQFLLNFPRQPIDRTHLPTRSSYTSPTSSQSVSSSCFIAHDHISFYPSSLVSNQIPSSQYPQGHFGNPLPVQPHLTMPTDLPGLREFRAGSRMELHETSTFDNRAAYTLSDHPLPTLPDHSAGPISGGIANYRKVDRSECSSTGLYMQSSLPAKKFLPLLREPHPLNHLSRIEDEGGGLSGPRTTRRLPKTRLVCDRSVSKPCGWRYDNGTKCGAPVTHDCANHFAAVHGLKNIARDIEIICRWCPTKKQRKVIRNNMLRHLREVHLGYPRATDTKR